MLFVTRKNQLSLKIKNFQMISIKWIKSLTNFYWLEIDLCCNCIWNCQDLLIVLVEHLLSIVKGFKNLKKQVIWNIYVEMDEVKLVLLMMHTLIVTKNAVVYIINKLLSRTSHIRNKAKAILYLSNHATKKESQHARYINTSYVTAKKILLH